MTGPVLFNRDVAGGVDVARLTLNRADRANSLTAEMAQMLCAHLAALADDPPDAVVLAGAGAHFSSGGDVKRFAREVAAGRGRDYAGATVGALHAAMLAMTDLPCPVIARLTGATTGGAAGLALAADMVAMQSQAFLQPWYPVVGFSPDGGWTALLPDLIGPGAVMSALCLNRRIDAAEARGLRLATDTAEEVDALIDGWLATLAGHRTGSIRASKRLVWDDVRRAALAGRLNAEMAAFLDRIEQPDTIAGMAAFLERRT